MDKSQLPLRPSGFPQEDIRPHMKNINRFIKEKFLENVSGDNYFLLKKAEQLFKSNVVFLAFMLFLITPVHLVKLEAKPILFVGDLTAIFGLLISFLSLRIS